jgi:hypothetical protein
MEHTANGSTSAPGTPKKRVLVVGAGAAGEFITIFLRANPKKVKECHVQIN